MRMLFSLFLFFSLAVNAESFEYQSFGGADLTIGLNTQSFYLGDALGKVKKCDDAFVFCLDLKGYKIVIPKLLEKPLSHVLSDGTVVTYLPIKREVTILGKVLSGYKVTLECKDGNYESTVFFNDKGVIYFNAFGTQYISKDNHGFILN